MNKSTEYKRVFNHFDQDGNGTISPSELHRRFGSIFDDQIQIEDVQQVVIESSLHGSNGELGFEEFLDLMESEKEDERIEDLRKAFRMYKEMDGSECITPRSLNRMLNRLGERTSVDECVGMIRRFDVDGDGVLSFDEFRAMMV